MSEPTDERSLESLGRGIRRCRKCRLHESRTHAVPGEGPPDAAIMLVGEGPGAKEDAAGRPFVGPSGRFLDEVLARLGLDRDAMFITSAVKCRPPGNRNPHAGEMETCRDAWLWRQIGCVQPGVIVLLGKTAIRCLLGEHLRIRDAHGRVRNRDGLRFLLTCHPTAAMRFPDSEKQFRNDLAKLDSIEL